MSPVRVLQILEPLETNMVVNFRIRKISRGARKLTRTLMLIIIKKYINNMIAIFYFILSYIQLILLVFSAEFLLLVK